MKATTGQAQKGEKGEPVVIEKRYDKGPQGKFLK